ncbi:MAG: hypothetical protein HYV28_02375 [Ignavibacteriales bacterium]|nr:hypothetical protein [Ignavibacteriales bacterium]
MRESVFSVGNLKNLLRFIILVFIAWGVYEYFFSYRIIYYECNGVTITRINEDSGRYYFLYGKYNYFTKGSCTDFVTGPSWALDECGGAYIVFHKDGKVQIVPTEGLLDYSEKPYKGKNLSMSYEIEENYQYDSLKAHAKEKGYSFIKVYEFLEREKKLYAVKKPEVVAKY